ncbi:MAG TPA: peptide-methionine (R)-S-oxide reductase MsrB [Burkholderiales bacterium]|nr:peptide-methionine (R)-S-oxide reductase MsrB [Burkholderiales bacterium]
MTRRSLLQGLLTGGLWSALTGRGEAAQAQVRDMKGVEELQKNWKSYLAEGYKAPLPTEPLKLSKEEWRKRLAPDAYKVLREEGTERAGTSPLDREKREGVFVCAGCDLPVYTSAMKYDSGTGWPSFFTTIPGVFETKTDRLLFIPRTEYHCKRCGGHHGHVFDDGPPPTGQRWCNNGVALKFVPRTGKT